MRSNFARFVFLEVKSNELKTSLAAVAGCLLIPVLFTMMPQSLAQAALPTELWLPLMAIFCFGSLFLPEQIAGVAPVINSKTIQLRTVYALRFTWYTLLLTVINSVLIAAYQLQGASLASGLLWGNAATKMILIGSISVFSYRFSHSLAVAYLVPTVYFALCIGSNQLGVLNLLTLMRMRPITDNWWQLGVAGVLLASSWVQYRWRLGSLLR